jgi:hypothetical protein
MDSAVKNHYSQAAGGDINRWMDACPPADSTATTSNRWMGGRKRGSTNRWMGTADTAMTSTVGWTTSQRHPSSSGDIKTRVKWVKASLDVEDGQSLDRGQLPYAFHTRVGRKIVMEVVGDREKVYCRREA